MPKGLSRIMPKGLLRVAIYLGGFFMVFPFLWMASSSLKNDVEAFATPPTIWPHKPTLINYNHAFALADFPQLFMNSLLVSVIATLLQVFTSGLAGYAFARMQFRGKNVLFLVYLATMMVPLQVIIVPLFLEMRALNLVDSYAALILPSIATAFGVFLIRQAMLAIPKELEEAAILDGANHWQIFRTVAAPLCGPSFATLGILSFMATWNSFLWPLIAIYSPEKMTLPLGLSNLQGEYSTDWPMIMAGTTLAVIPVTIVYFILQKQITQSFLTTGIK
jgi:multiple sugar transport system permease protein